MGYRTFSRKNPEKRDERRMMISLIGFIFPILICGLVHTDQSDALELYVSPDGNDSNSGDKDKPLRTLEAARDAIRQAKGDGDATVWLCGGRYHLTETFVLDERDSGSKDRPVVYRGMSDQQVILSGGTNVDPTEFRPIIDDEYIQRLNPTARGHVVVADLSDTDLAELFPGKGKYAMLAWNEHLLQLARWPNKGYHHIADIQDKGPTTRWLKPGEEPTPYSEENPTGGKFTIRESWPQKVWQQEFERTGDMVVEGYPHNDWFFQRERVGSILDDAVIQLLRHTRYGIEDRMAIPRRVRLVNVLYELDQPGEWYFDQQEKKLYLWPLGDMKDNPRIAVLGGPPLIELENTEYVTLRDLNIENGGQVLVSIHGGKHNLLAGSTIRNGLGRGIEIRGGTSNGIAGCDFYGLHQAISISGGDPATLTPCHNYAVNNDIHDCRLRGYGLIGLRGVGIYFAHNLLHDMNGAIAFNNCNDVIIEYNEFYNMGWEMGDWNVAYCGAQWWTYGNILRYNFVHHLMETPQAYPVGAFRNDDGGAGTTFYGNIFYKAGRFAVAFAGPGNRMTNNIVLETTQVFHCFPGKNSQEEIQKAWDELKRYDRGELRRGDKGDHLWKTEQVVGKQGWNRPPWSVRYPLFKALVDTGNPFSQTLSLFTGNYAGGVRQNIYVHKGSVDDFPESFTWREPLEIGLEDAFVNPDVLDFRLRDTFKPFNGFEPIPFERIGLYLDEYRRSMPDKETYRRAMRQRYDGVRSHGGRYDPDTVNERYPDPPYLRLGN
ncbi:right-handed parallel beta-helix repeat-containing protein [Candidatus Poribacteria bacterium]